MKPLRGGIAIHNGQIVALLDEASALEAKGSAATIIDAGERLVLPGLIDGHVHLRDPGQTYKEDFSSGTRAAAAGGVTTIIAQPNTIPEIADSDVFETVRQIGEQRAVVDFGIAARLDVSQPQEAHRLADAGAACFDLSTNTCDSVDLIKMLVMASSLPLPLGCYCEDAALTAHAADAARQAGLRGAQAFLAGLPDEAETAAAAHLWYLARAFGTRLLFRQVSTAATLEFLVQARQRQGATCAIEVNPHHLQLTSDDTRRIGAAAKIKPPLRARSDNEALWNGLARGSIDLVGTDHAPHAPNEKAASFENAPPGFAGLETFLPVLMNGVSDGRTCVERLIEVACEFPARWFGLAHRKGSLLPGRDADLVIVDQTAQRPLNADTLQTKAADSPFVDQVLTGWPVATMVRGTVIWEEDRLQTTEGFGRHLPAKFDTAK